MTDINPALVASLAALVSSLAALIKALRTQDAATRVFLIVCRSENVGPLIGTETASQHRSL